MKRIIIAVLVAVGACLGTFRLLSTQSAQADDADHITSIGTGSFDFSGTSEGSVNAVLTTTASGDDKLFIRLYLTPNGGTERFISRSEIRRNGKSGSFEATASIRASELVSGDQLRAAFNAVNASNQQTFAYQRTYTKP